MTSAICKLDIVEHFKKENMLTKAADWKRVRKMSVKNETWRVFEHSGLGLEVLHISYPGGLFHDVIEIGNMLYGICRKDDQTYLSFVSETYWNRHKSVHDGTCTEEILIHTYNVNPGLLYEERCNLFRTTMNTATTMLYLNGLGLFYKEELNSYVTTILTGSPTLPDHLVKAEFTRSTEEFYLE